MLAAAEYAYQYWLSQPAARSLHQLTRRALDVAASGLCVATKAVGTPDGKPAPALSPAAP